MSFGYVRHSIPFSGERLGYLTRLTLNSGSECYRRGVNSDTVEQDLLGSGEDFRRRVGDGSRLS
jgi:hypothetical protein